MKGADFIGPEVHQRAREFWGLRSQLIALAEELCETGAAVLRLLNGKATVEQVREELTDVESLKLSIYHDLGTDEEWEADRQRKRAKLLSKLEQGVHRV